ncbi:hypothetical protein EG68_08076 [Paragonimus skrjabini miyazakii]|uniref:ATP-dependent DNA helicase n=1 Tax=Paragonimus skrjabini miyazakii TaxID=59628 RepID=A0A8S9YQW5_9TREM|nr:hypothetical protein EG68_08076 [Paragonimus skrjabini miyazakii]
MEEVNDSGDLQYELDVTKEALDAVDREISSLVKKKRSLRKRYEEIESQLTMARIRDLSNSTRSCSSYDQLEGFPWSSELRRVRDELFHIANFRPLQLRAINATMDCKDVILVMPTGAGKSLVYQIPAFLNPTRFTPPNSRPISCPITLVICPLVSLMTDQTMGLNRLGTPAGSVKLFDASTPIHEQKEILDALAGKSKTSPLRLLYITPEKLAKSKRLLNRLEATFAQNRLQRIAIDEVHCVSQWGHDFRPDYQFLHVLRRQFPTVPLVGLTATASGSVIVDIQSMLGLQPGNCLVLRSGYNRKNLFYEVTNVIGAPKHSIDHLYCLIDKRYRGKTGIVYCLSQKDTEEVAQELRQKGLPVAPYHANMDPADRSRIHMDWFGERILVIVATVAFGMGIDKPNVRFVVHFSASKSLENYYQESGRAGRDSDLAECVLIWRFADLFRLASMVSAERTGLTKLYGMVAYCLDPVSCRRSLIATHLDDPSWSTEDCPAACDNCLHRQTCTQDEGNVVSLELTKLLEQMGTLLQSRTNSKQEKVTGPKLVDLMASSSIIQRLSADLLGIREKPDRAFYEHVVAWCLVNGWLKLDFHYTPYSTVCYVVFGTNPPCDTGSVNMPYWCAQKSSGRKRTLPVGELDHTDSSKISCLTACSDDSK